jgi:hypothetical protein
VGRISAAVTRLSESWAARMELAYWLTNERAENPGQNRDVNDAPVSQFIFYQFVFVLQRFFLTLSKWILLKKYVRINRLEVSNTTSFRFVFFLNTFSQFSEPNSLKLELGDLERFQRNIFFVEN